MGYLHIDNLYKSQDVLLFRECYALEKVHGTSAHVRWNANPNASGVGFFAGGASHKEFVALFDEPSLVAGFTALGLPSLTVFGEAYGGKMQGMRSTYGEALRFIVFDVQVGDVWLAVPQAEDIATKLGLEFVPYAKISTDLAALDAERDADSVVAQRRGCAGKKREGIVIRPLIEVRKNNGDRIIAKHRLEEFSERKTPQKVMDPAQLKVLTDAKAVAEEWVTEMRLTHVLGRLDVGGRVVGVENMREVIDAMVEDVTREAAGEIVDSKAVRSEIGKATALMFKRRVQARLRESAA